MLILDITRGFLSRKLRIYVLGAFRSTLARYPTEAWVVQWHLGCRLGLWRQLMGGANSVVPATSTGRQARRRGFVRSDSPDQACLGLPT